MKRFILICLMLMLFVSIAYGNWRGDFDRAGIDANGSKLIFQVPVESTNGVGEITSVTGATVAENGTGVMYKTVFTLSAVDVALTDNAGVAAYGGLKLYDFPEGYIYIIGSSSDIALTKSSAGVNDDWEGDFALGTVTAIGNAVLATTEQDILPTTATPEAVAGVTTSDGVSTATEHAIIDGHTTALDLYINYLVDDADQDVTTTPCNLILNGTVTVLWTSIGDN